MKKLFISLFFVLVLASVSFGIQAGITVSKVVNGPWELSVPINFEIDNLDGPRVYLLTRAVFTAPRDNFKAMNHSHYDLTFGGGYRHNSMTGDFDTTATYWWAENNEKVPEGFIWKNSLNLYSGNRYF